MTGLFKQLIYKTKTRRWFELLTLLEQKEHVMVKEFVDQTHYTRRTILQDVKELKAYFGSSILWIGDENGYHFSLQDPYAYEQKKQALLAGERLFVFFNHLANEHSLDNAQLAQALNVSLATVGRLKHRLQMILRKDYRLKLDAKTNLLVGKEADIRQVLYDFYFTLPVYPEDVEEKVKELRQRQTTVQPGEWQLDQTRINHWLCIAQLRVTKGKFLPVNDEEGPLIQALVQAFNQQVTVLLPDQEKVALFLLSLEEEQFLNPLAQKVFLQTFSPSLCYRFLIRADEGLAYQFLATYLSMMLFFFRLPPQDGEGTEKVSVREKAQVLDRLLTTFSLEKENYQKSLYVTYHLTGSAALKSWIKKEVEKGLTQAGRVVVESPVFDQPLFLRHLQVSNDPDKKETKPTIFLPEIPKKEDIQHAIDACLGAG